MKSRLHGCALCGKKLDQARPVFLVVNWSSEIVGPLHAECASRLNAGGLAVYDQLRATDRVVGHVLTGELKRIRESGRGKDGGAE